MTNHNLFFKRLDCFIQNCWVLILIWAGELVLVVKVLKRSGIFMKTEKLLTKTCSFLLLLLVLVFFWDSLPNSALQMTCVTASVVGSRTIDLTVIQKVFCCNLFWFHVSTGQRQRMRAYPLTNYKVGNHRRQSFWIIWREIKITWDIPQFLWKSFFSFL